MGNRRLPLSVLIALGLGSTGVRCKDPTEMTPCLSYVPLDPDTTPDAHACLSIEIEPPPDPAIQPCLEMMPDPDPDTRAQPPIGPCLSPVREPEPRPDREGRACLSEAPPDLPDENKASRQDKSTARTSVLDRGVLPEDVAQVLRDRQTHES